MFIDTHAHLQWKDYQEDLSQVLENAKLSNIELILNVGTSLETSKEGIELAEKYPHIFSSVGVHPHDVKELPSNYLEILRRLAQHKKVMAIGEIGLDFYYEHSPKESQLKTFKEQVELAKELFLPLSIHCRDAFLDCFKILKEVGPLPNGGVFHCFTGTKEEAKEALAMEFYLSFSGIITFRKAESLQEVVKTTPLEKILIETDAPYLAPEPYRGKRNEPAYVIQVAKKISEIKNIPLEEIGKMTSKNAKEIFKFSEDRKKGKNK